MEAVCFGECMIELARAADGTARVGFAGDTYNTAVYLARFGVRTAYMSAVGRDAWSADMRTAWANEGVFLSLSVTHPIRAPGLYAIATDTRGERSFTYWRDQSAARAFFSCSGAEEAIKAAEKAQLLYFSGITLAIFTPAERARIVDLAAQVRARGGIVAFDPNFRPRLWPDVAEFRDAVMAVAPHVSIALPSFDDEETVWADAAPEDSRNRWLASGAAEVVVKNGAHGALTTAGWAGAPAVATPLDTTGAGDSFNAGYIAARRKGLSPERAARFGARLAARVIEHPGAIMPAAAMPKLELEPAE
jgi:2-dehydro-3-deoxygluconokinase